MVGMVSDFLRFGTAGIPPGSKGHDTSSGIANVRSLGLDAMEMEFVRGIYLNAAKAPEVKAAARKHDVTLTVHAPYYINLNSTDKKIRHASVQRVAESAIIGETAGAVSVTFHGAYYQKQDAEKVYSQVKEQIKKIIDVLKEKGCSIWIRPELTGKPTQWGDLNEIIRISQELEQVMPCIDFAHMHARSGGKENSYAEFSKTLEILEKGLGREILDNMHIHVSGINYSQKGERNHLQLTDPECDFRYKELLKAFKEFRVKGVVVAESPVPWQDALLLKKEFETAR